MFQYRFKTVGYVSKRIRSNEPFGSPAEVPFYFLAGGRNHTFVLGIPSASVFKTSEANIFHFVQ